MSPPVTTAPVGEHDDRPRLGRRIAHFNKLVTNRLTRPLAPWLPGFGVITHVGRKSHREYQTPVNVFRSGDGFVVALTYGKEADWVQNVLAAGGCELVTRGKRYRLARPRIVHDESRKMVPPLPRPILRLVRVFDFLQLDASPA